MFWGKKEAKKFLESARKADMNLSKLWEIVKDRKAWHASVHGVAELDTV